MGSENGTVKKLLLLKAFGDFLSHPQTLSDDVKVLSFEENPTYASVTLILSGNVLKLVKDLMKK